MTLRDKTVRYNELNLSNQKVRHSEGSLIRILKRICHSETRCHAHYNKFQKNITIQNLVFTLYQLNFLDILNNHQLRVKLKRFTLERLNKWVCDFTRYMAWRRKWQKNTIGLHCWISHSRVSVKFTCHGIQRVKSKEVLHRIERQIIT